MQGGAKRNPWLWIPTLYFLEGIPYFIVNNISVMMFTRMGVPNDVMAMATSSLYLPWVIKPLWSPFVDIIKTKRWWIIVMQMLIAAALVGLTLSIPHPSAEMIAIKGTPIGMFQIALAIFIIMAFASATHDIAADGFYMLALDSNDQSFFVGIRSTFYRLSSIFGQGVLVYIAGMLEESTGNIPRAWVITMLISSVIFLSVTLYHTFAIPRPVQDAPRHFNEEESKFSQIIDGFGKTFVTFFKKPQVLIAIVFMLLYRLPEAFLIKMINPFLVDPESVGGLGMQTKDVGIIYGTFGVLALTIGGIIGGIAASKWGLKKSLWPMAACMTLPCATFVYLAVFQPANLWIICICVMVEQFGYGFGFTAYMLYMMYFAEGEFKTSHYALCTAFMALSMMVPGFFAGKLQMTLGYQGFFWMVMCCCLATVFVTMIIKVDPNYGKDTRK